MYKLKKDGTKVEVELSIDNNEWEEGVQKVYEANKGKFNITGFRKGHAPKKVIEKTYGDNVFFEDTVEFFVNKTMNEILEKEPELEPVAMPQTQFESFTVDGGLKMKIMFEIVPDFELCQYTGQNIEVHTDEVTDHEVEHYIHHLLEDNATFDVIDRAIKSGDVAVIDFMGFIDNKEFPGGSATDYSLEIGSHSFIDNFEDQLIGHKKGEVVDVNVTFPNNYHSAEFQGKKATFKVTIKEVKEKTLPTFDDKFVANATEFETADEYRKHVTAHIQDMKHNDQEAEYEYNIRHYLIEHTNIQIPDIMISSFVDYEIKNMREALKPYNITLEDYIMQTGGGSLSDYLTSIKERTLNNIKARYIYRKIIEKEKITVPAKELAEATKDLKTNEEKVQKENELVLTLTNKFLKEHNNKVVVPEDEE